MTRDPWRSVDGVCDVELVRGARAGGAPDVLLEVPHGATRAADFDGLRSGLRGNYPGDLRDFFFVNTDVGAPDVARRVAELVSAGDPRRSAAVIRSRIPRTFVDCNRVIEADPRQRSAPGEVTPGLHAWVRDEADRALLLGLHARYRELVERAFEEVCAPRGLALMVHSYAPRSVDVAVDEDVVRSLRAAYQPDKVGSWPLRAPVDLIVDAPDGSRLASPELLEHAQAEFAAAGYEVVLNGAYSLHPSTLAHVFATRHAGRTLCLELRRDLLVRDFTPFAEMFADPARVERAAAPLARAVLRALERRAPNP
jgi:N-formylglutamate amidohydrolase